MNNLLHRPQKYESRDPFPSLPFADDHDEGIPTLSEALFWFLAVAFLTVVFCEWLT